MWALPKKLSGTKAKDMKALSDGTGSVKIDVVKVVEPEE